MDNNKNDSYYIDKILNDIEFIIAHMSGVGKADLEKDEVLQDSMMFRLVQISENSGHLSQNFKDENSHIPWGDISGLRNRIVHDYGNVDLGIVYATLTDDINYLKNVFEGL